MLAGIWICSAFTFSTKFKNVLSPWTPPLIITVNIMTKEWCVKSYTFSFMWHYFMKSTLLWKLCVYISISHGVHSGPHFPECTTAFKHLYGVQLPSMFILAVINVLLCTCSTCREHFVLKCYDCRSSFFWFGVCVCIYTRHMAVPILGEMWRVKIIPCSEATWS